MLKVPPGGSGAAPLATSDPLESMVERGADHCRTDVAKLVDPALVDYLRRQGFEEPPPKR